MPPGRIRIRSTAGIRTPCEEGVPKGENSRPVHSSQQSYPGTQHTFWVYVPAQYDRGNPAALMVYQDVRRLKDETGISGRRT